MVKVAQGPGEPEGVQVQIEELEQEPLQAPASGYIGYAFPGEQFAHEPTAVFPTDGDELDPLVRDVIMPVIQNAWQHYQAGMEVIRRIQENIDS